MTKVSMKLQYPKTVGDAAVVRLEQILKSFELGHVAATDSKYRGALQSWRASAAEIIAKANASAKLADWDQSSRNEIARLRKIKKTARAMNAILHAVMCQAESDLASAHAEICKLQNLDPAKHEWPKWSPQANSLRWFEAIRQEFPAPPDPGRPVPHHGSGP